MQAACEAVAILLHYFFTAAFTWSLCEGILFCSIAFDNAFRREKFYFILGWGEYEYIAYNLMLRKQQIRCIDSVLYTCVCISIGIPVLIVVISAAVAHDQYGHDDL